MNWRISSRSVILCTRGDTFWIDEAWLSSQDNPPPELIRFFHRQRPQSYEKQLIEVAVAESNGKVAGQNGVAAKLGIPRSSLDAKIKQFNIRNTVSGKFPLSTARNLAFSQNCVTPFLFSSPVFSDIRLATRLHYWRSLLERKEFVEHDLRDGDTHRSRVIHRSSH